jgi:hypothetical protein
MTTSFSFDAPGSLAFVPTPEVETVSPTSTELVQNTQHGAEAISHLIEFFRNGPRNQALLAAVGVQLQEVEDALWQLYTERNIETAIGAQLDILGRIVGELRGDRADEDYRAAIRVRILVNSSDGKAEQLIAIVLGMLPDADITLTESYPAAIRVEVTALFGAVTVETVGAMLQQAKPAGVRLTTVFADLSSVLLWGATPSHADLVNGWDSGLWAAAV